MDHKVALENLIDLDSIFRETNSEYWLSCGTLLGLHREKDFIAHDTDTDVCVNIESLDRNLLDALKAKGFTIYHKFGRLDDGFEIAVKRKGVKTDLFFFYKKKDYWYVSSYSDFRNKQGMLKTDYVFSPFGLEEREFKGHMFMTPDNIEKYIIENYGEDWRIPNAKWDYTTSPPNAVKTKIRVLAKDTIEDFNSIEYRVNKNYWDEFYKKNEAPEDASPYAHKVLQTIKDEKIEGKLLDIACGNGRDSKFFAKAGIDVTGIDLSVDLNTDEFKYKRDNLFVHDYSGYNIFYLRFVVHSLKEHELTKLIEKFKALKGVYHIFIETRSTTGITDEDSSETNFKSSVGKEHFRQLYSKEYLDEKLKQHFNIITSEESNTFAVHKDDKPWCLRYHLTDKKE